MHGYLIEMLECPVCHGELHWTIMEQRGERIETAEARCMTCASTYPVREGIGVFLTPDLPRRDLWDEVESGLARYLRTHPEIERRLMGMPLGTLAPADQFFRAMVLEERGRYAEAKIAAERARSGLYTSEYLACYRSQIEYLIGHLVQMEGPIVDLASGRGGLVEEMAQRLPHLLIATDFSPRVLRRDRRWLEFFGLYDRVSLLAFDARRMPFKDGAVGTMTTNLGLVNIERPGDLVQELRRVISGTLLAICHFFPEEDEANAAAIRELGLVPFSYRRSTLEHFAAAGFEVELENVQVGKARPTPLSELIEGAEIDALPVAETELEWCVLVARCSPVSSSSPGP